MDAGKALYTAATAYAQAGQWGMAREAYMLLLDKYPGHPLTHRRGPLAGPVPVEQRGPPTARTGPVRRTHRDLTFDHVERKPPKPQTDDPEAERGQAAAGDGGRPGDAPATLPGWCRPASGTRQRWSWRRRLAAHGDLFARDVPTNLCLAAARRQLGKAEESQRWFAAVHHRDDGPARGPDRRPAGPTRGGSASCSNRGW